MPSPIAHAAMGYAIYTITRKHLPQLDAQKVAGPISASLVASVGFSLLPDMDVIPAVLSGNFAAFHNNFTHSLIFGLTIAVVAAGVAWFADRRNALSWFLLALGCYTVHIGMDFLTPGRGVMLLWPLTPDRFEPAFFAFYGVHWSDPLTSMRHVWTVLTEFVFVSVITTGALAYRRAALARVS